MTPNAERRPGATPEPSSKNFTVDTDPTVTRPRCARCGAPLEAHRSVARGFGPVCWTRTALGQLDRRRDAVGRRLASLAARVAGLDVRGLALVAAAIEDAVEALDEEVNS